MEDDYSDVNLTHPDMKDVDWRPEVKKSDPQADRWPDQQGKRGPARSVTWPEILTVVDEGIKAIYFGHKIPWYDLKIYDTYGGANRLMHRLRREYAEGLPLGTWDFRVESDKELDRYTLQAKYSPRKFSDIRSIRKVAPEVTKAWIDLLTQYAERVRRERENQNHAQEAN